MPARLVGTQRDARGRKLGHSDDAANVTRDTLVRLYAHLDVLFQMTAHEALATDIVEEQHLLKKVA